MPLSPDESTLLSLRAPVCSVVFSALTDPSVQLQLVGIRALTVLGSLQGWCLVSLGEAEGGVTLFWEIQCHMAAGTSLPAAYRCTGAVAAVSTQAMSSRDTWSLSCLFALATLYLWCLGCCCSAASLDQGEGCWPEHRHLCLWLRAGFLYGSCCRLPVSLRPGAGCGSPHPSRSVRGGFPEQVRGGLAPLQSPTLWGEEQSLALLQGEAVVWGKAQELSEIKDHVGVSAKG